MQHWTDAGVAKSLRSDLSVAGTSRKVMFRRIRRDHELRSLPSGQARFAPLPALQTRLCIAAQNATGGGAHGTGNEAALIGGACRQR